MQNPAPIGSGRDSLYTRFRFGLPRYRDHCIVVCRGRAHRDPVCTVSGDVVARRELGIGTGRLEVIETPQVPGRNRHSVGSAQWLRVCNVDLDGMVWDSGKKQRVVSGSESQFEKDHPTKFASNWFELAGNYSTPGV